MTAQPEVLPSAPANRPTRMANAEISYLLHLVHGDRPCMAKERLQLPTDPEESVLRHGVGGLYAHHGMVIEGNQLMPQGEAALIGLVLTGAEKWVEIGFRQGKRAEVIHLAEGDGLALMINHLPFGVFEFLAVQPGLGLADVVMGVVTELLAAGNGPSALVVNAVGFETESPVMQAMPFGDGYGILTLNRGQELPPGVTTVIVAAMEPPGLAWQARGAGEIVDVLSWVAATVGAGPNDGSAP